MQPKTLKDFQNREGAKELSEKNLFPSFGGTPTWDNVVFLKPRFDIIQMIQSSKTDWSAIDPAELLPPIQQFAIRIMYLRRKLMNTETREERINFNKEVEELWMGTTWHIQKEKEEETRTENLGALSANILSCIYVPPTSTLRPQKIGGDEILMRWMFRDWFLEPTQTLPTRKENHSSKRKIRKTYMQPTARVAAFVLNQPSLLQDAVNTGEKIYWNGGMFRERLLFAYQYHAYETPWLADPKIPAKQIFQATSRPEIIPWSKRSPGIPASKQEEPVKDPGRLLEIAEALTETLPKGNAFDYIRKRKFSKPDVFQETLRAALNGKTEPQTQKAATLFLASQI